MKYVTLCSGGIDSVVLAQLLQSQGAEQVLLLVNYGQPHKRELLCAQLCAHRLGLAHIKVDITSEPHIFEPEGDVFPNRNAVLASLAVSAAVTVGAEGIALGVHHTDYEGFPDCRPGFFRALEYTTGLALENPGFKIHTPFIDYSKWEIVDLGHVIGVPFEDTWTCYRDGAMHCGECAACLSRKKAFAEAEIPDPIFYEGDLCW